MISLFLWAGLQLFVTTNTTFYPIFHLDLCMDSEYIMLCIILITRLKLLPVKMQIKWKEMCYFLQIAK